MFEHELAFANGLADRAAEIGMGLYLGDGLEIRRKADRSLVTQADTSIESMVREQIAATRAAIEAIEGPLDVALVSHREQVVAAHDAIRELHRTIGVDVAGALAVTISFNDTDGD